VFFFFFFFKWEKSKCKLHFSQNKLQIFGQSLHNSLPTKKGIIRVLCRGVKGADKVRR